MPGISDFFAELDRLWPLPSRPRITFRLIGSTESALHKQHRVYLDIVTGGFPFLPQQPTWHPVELPGVTPANFDLVALDIVDVVVSKLARLSDDDLADIEAMAERGKVPHQLLVERFKKAVDWAAYDAQAYKLPLYLERLHRIERDVLDVDETPIDLSWVKD